MRDNNENEGMQSVQLFSCSDIINDSSELSRLNEQRLLYLLSWVELS